MANLNNIGLFIATVLGAVGLFCMMPQRGNLLRGLGALIGLAFLAVLWVVLGQNLTDALGIDAAAFFYHYVFGFIAIAAAVRVITHTQPVRAALWFIMVVLSSAGLLLTLSAEFIALAMIVIYGGAILVTYMFVIMLAAQSAEAEAEDASPLYDRRAREPMLAILAGFVLLSTLLSFSFQPNTLPEALPQTLGEPNPLVRINDERLPEEVVALRMERSELSNLEAVGLDLFRSHPLAIELAGVILLISLIGAVVIARTEVPDDEDPAKTKPISA
ncbi:NADH-quinone oxidoreductase subunit J family protein [Mucisphaera sp.]|uniref:NADH-quinone oxidoreductase subunit J family protein n=1 Tax=Mucisphaera sp. TaxID=2913024 RepID=UPI003D106B50